MRNWRLTVEELPDPVPGAGQALTKVLACGICGSDLHMLRHGEEQLRLGAELAQAQPPDPMRTVPFTADAPVVMGHEFCCEVVETGPGCTNVSAGDLVVSLPVTCDAAGMHALGYSNAYPGGYADLVVVSDLVAMKVPNGLDPSVAALTEPLAVGVHAVNKSRVAPGDAAVVLGCGPVGLAVIAALAMKGIGPIVAADFSPKRRALATRLGAHEVVDPRDIPAIEAWRRVDGSKPLVVFEAVGVPGMLDAAMRMAPRDSRILVVGVCMQPDRIFPMVGIGRELNIQFALAYDPVEFGASLHALAEGTVDFGVLLTGQVGIDGVAGAFEDLANPEAHAKILVRPGI